MTRLVTTELLVSKAACIAQVELFASLCPHGIVPTVDWCKQHANKFDWNWAARHLLSPAAQKAYEEAKATALKAYVEATATAWKAYEEATATAFARGWAADSE